MLDAYDLGAPGLLQSLSPGLRDELKNLGNSVSYGNGELIQSRGDDSPGISIVESGAVRIGNTGIDGSFLTTAILGAGQCFGEFTLFAGLPRTHEATAVGDTRLLLVPGPPFKRLFDAQPELAQVLLRIALIRTHGLLDFMDDLRRLPLPVRVAKTLLSIAGSARISGTIRTRQDDLAFALGVSRVSVGKVLQELQAQGLIELGYGCIHLCGEQELRAWVAARNVIVPLSPDSNSSGLPPRL